MAKRNTTATPRPRKKGDSTYNARRRYVREAERNLKSAETSTGATSARFRRLAREAYKKALQTYTDIGQKVSRSIREVGEKLGIDYQRRRETYAERGQDISRLERQSVEFTRAGREAAGKMARQREAETIFNSPIGKRIIGGLEDVWRESATGADGKVDKAKILPALFDYFGVDNLADLLDKVEDVVGDMLYAEGSESELYDTVRLVIAQKRLSGAFVSEQ